MIIFEVSMHFQRSKNYKESFQTILDKIFADFLTQSFFTESETELDYYHQNSNVRFVSGVVEQLNPLIPGGNKKVTHT